MKNLSNFLSRWFLRQSPGEWRESVKLIVSALLATGTWAVIGITLYSQLESSHKFANKIVPGNAIATPLNQEKISNIKDAQDMVDRTSSSIYALLTPIATAITGYFFASTGAKKMEGGTEDPGDPKNLKDTKDP
jgi:hypothetical protein